MDEKPGHAEWIKNEAAGAAHQRLTRIQAIVWEKLAHECSDAVKDFQTAGFSREEAMALLLVFLSKGQ